MQDFAAPPAICEVGAAIRRQTLNELLDTCTRHTRRRDLQRVSQMFAFAILSFQQLPHARLLAAQLPRLLASSTIRRRARKSRTFTVFAFSCNTSPISSIENPSTSLRISISRS